MSFRNVPDGRSVLQKIETKTLAAAATSMTFSGLNGDVDVAYVLDFCMISNSATTHTIDIRPNGLTTNQLLVEHYVTGAGPTHGAGNATTINWYALEIYDSVSAGTGIGRIWATMHAKSGMWRSGWSKGISLGQPGTVAASEMFDAVWAWKDTSTNITSLVITDSAANGMGIGTTATLYRMM